MDEESVSAMSKARLSAGVFDCNYENGNYDYDNDNDKTRIGNEMETRMHGACAVRFSGPIPCRGLRKGKV